MKRKASAQWSGDLTGGSGMMSTESGTLDAANYSFKTRFEGERGTNPEELIAAAHAGCFSMALSHELASAGFRPETVTTTAAVTLDKVDDGFSISAIELDVRAHVPGIDQDTFDRIAEGAKTGCPVSRVLNATITMTAQLAS